MLHIVLPLLCLMQLIDAYFRWYYSNLHTYIGKFIFVNKKLSLISKIL